MLLSLRCINMLGFFGLEWEAQNAWHKKFCATYKRLHENWSVGLPSPSSSHPPPTPASFKKKKGVRRAMWLWVCVVAFVMLAFSSHARIGGGKFLESSTCVLQFFSFFFFFFFKWTSVHACQFHLRSGSRISLQYLRDWRWHFCIVSINLISGRDRSINLIFWKRQAHEPHFWKRQIHKPHFLEETGPWTSVFEETGPWTSVFEETGP